MTCSSTKPNARHSGLCQVNYPYVRHAPSNNIQASSPRSCTRGGLAVPMSEVNQTLGYEANMDLINLDDLVNFVDNRARFGTYCPLPKTGLMGRRNQNEHFCVDKGRRTVDGRRLAWLWIFPDGRVRPSNKNMGDNPTMVWTKQQIIDAYQAAGNPALPMFTRHVEIHAELAITFCLPYPS